MLKHTQSRFDPHFRIHGSNNLRKSLVGFRIMNHVSLTIDFMITVYFGLLRVKWTNKLCYSLINESILCDQKDKIINQINQGLQKVHAEKDSKSHTLSSYIKLANRRSLVQIQVQEMSFSFLDHHMGKINSLNPGMITLCATMCLVMINQPTRTILGFNILFTVSIAEKVNDLWAISYSTRNV